MPRPRLSLLVPSLVSLSAAAFTAEAPPPTQPQPTPSPAAAGERIAVTAERDTGANFKPEGVATTKLDLPLAETPQSITVIPRDLMDAQGAFSLRDAVRNAPGLTIASGEGGVTGDAFSIRGFAANNDIYLDGMKDNGQYFRDTFNLEQVEVLKGSSALLFGRGSVGGAINQVTRKPGDTWTANAGVTAGTDRLVRGVVGVGGPVVADAVGMRLDAYIHDADSFRDEIHVNRKGIAPGVLLRIDERSSLLLQSFHQRESSDLDYGLPRWQGRPADVERSTFYGFRDDDFQTYDVDQYTATFSHQFHEHLRFRNATRLSQYERNYRTNIPSAAVSTAPGTAGTIYHTDPALDTTSLSQALRLNEQRNVFNQTDVNAQGTIAGREVSLLSGLELGRETYDFRSRNSTNAPGTQHRVSIFNPQPDASWGAGRADDLSVLNTHNESSATTVAVHSTGVLEIVRHLKGVAGVRWDQYDATYTGGVGVAGGTVTRFSHRDRMWSPRAGLIFEPAEDLSFYGSWGTAFSPTLENISGTLTATTADLAPEKTNTFELGTKADLIEERLMVTAAVFRVDKDNARVTDPSGITSLDGNQRSDGIEAGAAGTLTDRWKLFAGISLIQATYARWNGTTTYVDYAQPTVNGQGVISYPTVTVSQEGKTVTGVPKASGSLWTTYDLGQGFTLGGGLFAVGSRYVNAANTEELPGYARVDASLGYRQRLDGVTWTAQVNAFNLLDTTYFEATNGSFTTVGTPRAGQLSLTAAF
jgi:catecholate siderophore receptor